MNNHSFAGTLTVDQAAASASIEDERRYDEEFVAAQMPYAEESGLDFEAALEAARAKDRRAAAELTQDFIRWNQDTNRILRAIRL